MSTSICKCDLDTVTLYHTVTVIMTTCRQLVNDFGLWTQIRVDMGREWFLMFIQEYLSQQRYDTTKPAFLQTSSKQVCMHNIVP